MFIIPIIIIVVVVKIIYYDLIIIINQIFLNIQLLMLNLQLYY